MRAEDVKPGMWVQRESPFTEDAIVFQFGNQADNRRAWQAIYRDGSVGWCSHDTLHECEPWVPRVGEWVRLVRTDGVEEMRGPVVSFSTGHLVTFKPPDRACQFWGAAHGHHGGGWYVEPCAPPEAKPETRPADAYLDMLTAETRKACERIGPHLAAVLSEAAEESRQAPKPRDHNATCSRCGGRAYQGIGLAKCVEPVCDDPETREPDRVDEAADVRLRYGLDADGKQAVSTHEEMMFVATGRGKQGFHPTREGAIAAWRKAVRRG